MAYEDFDINGLATYLRLTCEQVTKLAERGKLPGRRVGGQWRFPRAEVHHWWEDRIGTSGGAELAQVETLLARTGELIHEPFSLADMLPIESIAIPLNTRTRSSAITAMVKLAENSGNLWDAAKMEEAVRARENIHPTALDNGVALLHSRRPLESILAQPFLALGITSQGIPFGGSRTLTDIFFLICSTEEVGHLRTLARLSRLVADNSFLSELRRMTNPADVPPLFAEYESKLIGR